MQPEHSHLFLWHPRSMQHADISAIFLFFSKPPLVVTDNAYGQEWSKFSFCVLRMSFESEGNYMSVYHAHFQGEGSRWVSEKRRLPTRNRQSLSMGRIENFLFYSMGVKEREFNYDSTP